MLKLAKETVIMGAGAAIGVTQTVLTKQYDQPIPYLSDYLGSWGYLSTGGNIIIGGVCVALTSFTNVFNKYFSVGSFLQIYGIATLVGGIVNGIFPGPVALRRAAQARGGVRLASPVQRASVLTPTGIPPARVLA